MDARRRWRRRRRWRQRWRLSQNAMQFYWSWVVNIFTIKREALSMPLTIQIFYMLLLWLWLWMRNGKVKYKNRRHLWPRTYFNNHNAKCTVLRAFTFISQFTQASNALAIKTATLDSAKKRTRTQATHKINWLIYLTSIYSFMYFMSSVCVWATAFFYSSVSFDGIKLRRWIAFSLQCCCCCCCHRFISRFHC